MTHLLKCHAITCYKEIWLLPQQSVKTRKVMKPKLKNLII